MTSSEYSTFLSAYLGKDYKWLIELTRKRKKKVPHYGTPEWDTYLNTKDRSDYRNFYKMVILDDQNNLLMESEERPSDHKASWSITDYGNFTRTLKKV